MSIFTAADTETLWQVTVPELARQHSFLMHGMLACSALQLAYSNPAQHREYSIKASSHQDRAMSLFRPAITKVSKDNCDAVFAFSHLLIIYSFASEKEDERLLLVGAEGPDVLPSWLYFLRAGCSMLCSVWARLEAGPVKALAAGWEMPIKVSEDDKRHLVEYLISVVLSRDAQEAWPKGIRTVYHDAAVELAWAFSCMRALDESFTTWDALRIWPMRISGEYMDLLSIWHPGALILLAHYCILLQKVESKWYFEDRATRLLSTILRRLDERWHCYIKWPLEEIGLSSGNLK